MSAEKIVGSTRTAAFSRGVDGVITVWNRRAEKLFAIRAESVIGRRCHEVIAGRDVFGNDYCCAECACWRMAATGRLVHPCRLAVRENGGRKLNIRVSILAVSSPDGPELVHLIEAVFGSSVFAVLSDELDGEEEEWDCAGSTMTRRELQVLRHLAAGNGTDDIARQLLISPATVRNHISRCLQKLEVHSRVEAVGVARRLDLV